MIPFPIVNTVVAAIVYNAVKKPKGGTSITKGRFDIKPYNGVVINGDRFIPTIGIEVGI